MNQFSGLLSFVKAADLGSFVAAGRALEMSASAVGKGVARLEQAMGVRLLQRSTRHLQLTDEGRLFHERCKRVLDELDDVQAMLSQSREQPRGRLRVSAPVVGHHFLTALLPGFVARYPEVELDIHYSDRAIDLIEAGVDVAIRSGALADSRLVSRPLQAFRLHLCASPAYLAAHGRPATVQALTRHATVRFRHPNTGKLLPWPLPPEAGDVEARLRTVLACNHIEAVLGACLRGMGIACLPDFLVAPDLAAGRLATVLDDQLTPGGRFHALWPSSRHLAPKVRAFIDHLSAELPTGAAGE